LHYRLLARATSDTDRDIMPSDETIEEMKRVIRRGHAGQFRNRGKVPYWQHCESVAEILEWGMAANPAEFPDPELRTTMRLAALGHDLYEDTQVGPDEVRAAFGPLTDQLIGELSNEVSDEDRGDYIAKLSSISEEARLIKLADSIENATSGAYAIHDMGADWTSNFLVPIMTEIHEAIGRVAFSKYPRTAERLQEVFAFSVMRLKQNARKAIETHDQM
jgi:(p)ppGpp synthase/HD superfamily hydrolase